MRWEGDVLKALKGDGEVLEVEADTLGTYMFLWRGHFQRCTFYDSGFHLQRRGIKGRRKSMHKRQAKIVKVLQSALEGDGQA